MAGAFVHLVIGSGNLRTEARMGGGFTILVGEPGRSQRVSFTSMEAARAFCDLCGLAELTHGNLGDAVAKTGELITFPSTRPTETPPSAA